MGKKKKKKKFSFVLHDIPYLGKILGQRIWRSSKNVQDVEKRIFFFFKQEPTGENIRGPELR